MSQSKEELNEEIFDKEKIYELKYIKLIIKDYASFPRTERCKLFLYILNVPMKISDFEKRFGHIIHAFKIFPEPKNFDKSMQFILTDKTDICFYYLEYRLLFFFDLTQSMLVFDLRQKILNIQKMERYLNLLLKSNAEYEDTLYNLNLEKIKYKPKVICTVACALNEEEIIFIKHAFILEKETFYNFYSKEISKKMNLILMKFHDKKRVPNINENKGQILFLYKILENCLLTFNLIPSSGNRILFLLTDGNIFLPNLGKYNNILMQYNRADISIQIIDMFYRNNFYGLTSPKFVNDIEINKYLAKFTGGNYINENLFIELFFSKEKEGDDKDKKDIFFYPSLYPNILHYNVNEKESQELWNKRFKDIPDQKQIHCDHCSKGFELFLCKKIIMGNKSKDDLDEIVVKNKEQITNLINKGINLRVIGLLSNYKTIIYNKELFESYKIKLSLALIIEARLRESFYLKKTKNKSKVKFIIYILPYIMIKYNLTSLNHGNILSSEYQVDIIIKGELSKMTQMKKELYKNKGQSEKVDLILNFIKQIICTDKMTLYFSDITHHNNFLNANYFKENENYMSKLSSLPVRNWHRFFNVMMCEVFIINKSIKVNNAFIQKFLQNQELEEKMCKQKKEYLKKKIFSFCDDYNEEINFGIKKISKEENKKDQFSHNGFLLINFDWSSKSLCLIYLGFFHCFLTERNTYYNKFKEWILKDANKEYIIEFNNGKHLTYFIFDQTNKTQLNDTQEKSNEKSDNKKVNNGLRNKINNLYFNLNKVEDYKNITNNIFTYSASEKLVNVYLKKYPKFFQIPFDSDSCLRNILEQLIIQRLKENFKILNWDSRKIVFFSYLTDLNLDFNIKNSFLDNIKNNPQVNNIIALYKIKIKEYKDEKIKKLVKAQLIFEPNDNLYLLTNYKNEKNIEEEKNNEKNSNENENKDQSYFVAFVNYFKEKDNIIKEKLKLKDEI